MPHCAACWVRRDEIPGMTSKIALRGGNQEAFRRWIANRNDVLRTRVSACGTTSIRCGVPCSIHLYLPYDDSDSRTALKRPNFIGLLSYFPRWSSPLRNPFGRVWFPSSFFWVTLRFVAQEAAWVARRAARKPRCRTSAACRAQWSLRATPGCRGPR